MRMRLEEILKDRSFEGHVDEVSSAAVRGWIWSPMSPEVKFPIRVFAGSKLIGEVKAQDFRIDLLNAKKGNGEYGFEIILPPTIRSGTEIRVELADAGVVFGTPRKIESPKRSIHQNEITLKFFAKSAPLLNHFAFRSVHSLTRKAIIGGFIPVLEKYLGCKLRVRHSATRSSDYHVLYSDVDLDEIIRKLSTIRRFFPFLGEVEVYTPEEIRDLASAIDESAGWHSRLRTWRKIVWLRNQKTTSEYHEQKRRRALKKCLPVGTDLRAPAQVLLQIAIETSAREIEDLSRLIEDEGGPVGLVRSRYFEMAITDIGGGSPAEPTLTLPSRHLKAILAIAPVEAGSKYRSNERLLRIYRGLLRAEFLTTQAFNRAVGHKNEEIKEWNATLGAWLEWSK